jgi:hypothetical protein
MHEEPEAFFLSLEDFLGVARFAEDYADHLMDLGRDEWAKDFLKSVKAYKAVTPEDEWTLDDLLDMARDYTPVSVVEDELNEPHADTYREAVAMLEALEAVNEPDTKTPALRFDQEAALVNRMIADEAPLDPERPEFPDVTVWVDDDWSVGDIVIDCFKQLVEHGYPSSAREFMRHVNFVLDHGAQQWDLFRLTWSYVKVQPEIGSKNERRAEMYGLL